MYRFLLSRQWVLFTLVALLLIPVFVQAGNWQYQRHEDRVERNELIGGNLDASPVPVEELAGNGQSPAADDRFRAVTAVGVYDQEREAVVRQRVNPDSGEQGYHVVTPLKPTSGGPVILVNRGWVAAEDDPSAVPEIPAPPPGEVTVTGRLMADETDESTGIRQRDGLPDSMIMMINSAERAEALGTPVVGGHVELTDTETADGTVVDDSEQPMRVPAPDHSGIGPHFAYALQWWFFALMVPVGWTILLRREARDGGHTPQGPDGAGGQGTGGGTGPDPTPDTGAAGPEVDNRPGPEDEDADGAPPEPARDGAGNVPERRLNTVG